MTERKTEIDARIKKTQREVHLKKKHKYNTV